MPAYRPPFTLTKKKELKKEHAFNNAPAEFPSLATSLSLSLSAAANMHSFSSAARKKILIPSKVIHDVLPGWVHIRKHEGKIQYKYGAHIVKPDNEERENKILGNIIYKYRLARDQYERDIDVDRLGDLSEYYGEKPIAEIYDNDIGAFYREEDEENQSDYYDYDYGNSHESSDVFAKLSLSNSI